MQFVEIDSDGAVRNAGYAPYLDYRPIVDEERARATPALEAEWLKSDLESKVLEYAVSELVPSHLQGVSRRKEELVAKTMAAVKDRLTKEINYWDHRAEELKAQELAGRVNARINSGKARLRADDLQARLQRRMGELEEERRLSPVPPVVIGGALVVPISLLARLAGEQTQPGTFAHETRRVAELALRAVMQTERRLGFDPSDVGKENRGYDIESRIPGTGKLRFIEVKGRTKGAETVTITKNEILTSFNKPEDFILALVEVDGDKGTTRYVRRPFRREPDFGVTSVNYDMTELLARAEDPC
jgi:RNase H-fold protein (predicted Holliday junction resolvase)